MKNKLFYDYCIDKRLIVLLGIKESEITEWHEWNLKFKFKRNNKEFIIHITTENKKSTLSINLKQVLLNLWTELPLITVTDVVDENGFEKFRSLMEVYFKEPIVVKANEL